MKRSKSQQRKQWQC